ncbi:MAG: enoyl-CoA hydratase/isomerase family protein [Betaproteobacteria bacterium]|nr:enoyl-CoA hydratase/isomerase family protein [Betaproteobacteria bacterium]
MSSELDVQRWADIVLTPKGSYAVISIEREAKRNAMNRACRQGLLSAFEFARGRFAAVVLTGEGNSFCAGVDLKERAEDLACGEQGGSAEWANVNIAIREHPAIFIAAVNGIALGGGATLMNVCDLAIAVDTAEFGMPEITFSTYPGMAGPATQLSGLTRKRISWMVLTGNRLPARTALEWGLINECVSKADLLPTAQRIAQQVAQYNHAALAASKQALDQIPANITDWRQALAYGELVNSKIQQRNAAAKAIAVPTHSN